jgi:hypothetical protein
MSVEELCREMDALADAEEPGDERPLQGYLMPAPSGHPS